MSFYAETIFPWILDASLNGPDIDRLTAEMLAGVQGDVLEIGFGSARTLPFYPATVAGLWAVEPSNGMSKRARERVARSPFPVQMVTGSGERLPFENARFDAVTLAFTFCSVQHPSAVMAEILRVLKPGGSLHVLEHVQSQQPKWQRWQQRLDPIQKIWACGCHLTRDPQKLIEQAGGTFAWHRREITKDFPGFPDLFPLFVGQATFGGK
jgi:ubiquinone/menaquinone biosynthesis C-methylase UbiE